ncbi:MAG: hypothetical protein GY708_27605 [Actinomycetia bacterium]|nr:hypothetical protein [Actinomycetes bacterium]MCP4959856.1 hypothetical protein [Actinomycetes bacterium]
MTIVDQELVQKTRVELAAVFRIAAKLGWHESVANHFSAAVSDDGHQFLMNPRWRHFELIRASELLLLDAHDSTVMDGPNPPDPSAWCIHGTIHAELPSARVLLHVHSDYATALAGLADPTIRPIDQNTARYHDRVAYDLNFGGIADEAEEAKRLADVMADKPVLLMGNHGVTVAASTIAEAFEDLYYFERACKTMILAYSTNQPLNIVSDDVANKVSTGWGAFSGMGPAHLDQQMELLDRDDPTYRD